MTHRLKEAREAMGISQADLANRIGSTQGAVAHWENGVRRLKSPFLERIAKELRISAAELLGYEVDFMPVPVLGQVAAGPWIEMFESHDPETIPFSTRARHAFALRVVGDSMDQVAPEGSFVIVDPDQIDADRLHGQLVVAKQHETCTFKRLDLVHGLLLPFSTRWQDPIPLNEHVQITGKVIGIIKDMD